MIGLAVRWFSAWRRPLPAHALHDMSTDSLLSKCHGHTHPNVRSHTSTGCWISIAQFRKRYTYAMTAIKVSTFKTTKHPIRSFVPASAGAPAWVLAGSRPR